jgi:hypothetical protein
MLVRGLPVFLILEAATVAAHAQCNATLTTNTPVTGADLRCMQETLLHTLQNSFLPLAGGTMTGVIKTVPEGAPQPMDDNSATLDFQGNRVNILKQVLTGQTNTPNLYIQLNNASPMPLATYGLYPQIGALSVASFGLAGSTASLDAAIFTLNLYGNKPYQAQDVAIQSTVNQYGSDSSWLFDGYSRDLSGMPPNDFSQVGIELDQSANGPDDPRASYDPLHTYRMFLAFDPGPMEWKGWEARTTYVAPGNNEPGSIIQQKNLSGVLSIYKATTGGLSGATIPAFPDKGTVKDGTVVWTYEQISGVEYGRGIWLDNGYGKWPVPDATVSYGSGFATDALFQDAVVDMSEATLAHPTSAGIRLAPNMPIDFSGNGTAAAQNLRVMQYTEKASAMTYSVKGNVALSIADTGLVSFPGQIQAPLATPKSSSSPCVVGTRTADASYEYVCVATNKWKRAVLTDF